MGSYPHNVSRCHHYYAYLRIFAQMDCQAIDIYFNHYHSFGNGWGYLLLGEQSSCWNRSRLIKRFLCRSRCACSSIIINYLLLVLLMEEYQNWSCNYLDFKWLCIKQYKTHLPSTLELFLNDSSCWSMALLQRLFGQYRYRILPTRLIYFWHEIWKVYYLYLLVHALWNPLDSCFHGCCWEVYYCCHNMYVVFLRIG